MNDDNSDDFAEISALGRALAADAAAAKAPADDFYFDDPTRAQQLKVLTHLTQYTNLVLYLEGEEGCGKTTLLHHWVERIQGDASICRLDAGELASAANLLERMAAAWGLTLEANATEQALQAQLEALHQRQFRPLLVIDDAEHLPSQALAVVIRLASAPAHRAAPLHAVLCGTGLTADQRELGRRVSASEGDVFKTLQLLPLDEDQTRAFIGARLAATGRAVTPTAEQLRRLMLRSGGLPGRLATLIDEMYKSDLRADAPAVREEISATAPARRPARAHRYLAATAILALATVGGFLMTTAFWQPGNRGTQIQAPSMPKVDRQAGVDRTMIAGDVPALALDGTSAEQPVPSVPELPPPLATAAPAVAPPVANAIEPVAALGVGEAEITTATRPATVTPTPPATPSPPAAKKTKIKGEAWLRRQNPGHYTLQLLGAGREKAVVDYVKRYRMEAQAAYFHTLRDGKDWYGLTYGIYADQSAARAAGEKLSRQLKGAKPWLRSMKSVQIDLAAGE